MANLVITGLQETRMKKPRAKPIGPYKVLASTAKKRCQGVIDLWLLSSWLDLSQPALVLFSYHRILLVSLHTMVGHIQVVVPHALDSSYTKDQMLEWWAQLKDAINASF